MQKKFRSRLASKSASARPQKISDHVERILLRINHGSEFRDECAVEVSHETAHQVLQKNNYCICTSRIARKKPLRSTQHTEKRLSFARAYLVQPDSYWDDVIFCDEPKISLYYNDRHNLKALERRQLFKALERRKTILTVEFGKHSVRKWMVCSL